MNVPHHMDYALWGGIEMDNGKDLDYWLYCGFSKGGAVSFLRSPDTDPDGYETQYDIDPYHNDAAKDTESVMISDTYDIQ